MAKSPIHCPLCNTRQVTGLGLVIYENSALVEYRCRSCGELFFRADQRRSEVTHITINISEGGIDPSRDK